MSKAEPFNRNVIANSVFHGEKQSVEIIKSIKIGQITSSQCVALLGIVMTFTVELKYIMA